MKDGNSTPSRGINIVVKFEMVLGKPEDTVITATAQPTVNVAGQTVSVGKHLVTFSGRAQLSSMDNGVVIGQAKAKDDDKVTQFDCEILVRASWNDVKQCSFNISPGKYWNGNSDEDDWQGWEVISNSWDLVQQGTTKRIRLKFALAQYGQNTLFEGVSYYVTATGVLGAAGPPPVPCDDPLPVVDIGSSGEASPFYKAHNVIDGNDNTAWLSTIMIHPWVQLALKDPAPKLCRVEIRWEDNTQYYFRVAITTAGPDGWSDVINAKSKGDPSVVEKYEIAEQTCKFLKLTILEDDETILPKSRGRISEIKLFGRLNT